MSCREKVEQLRWVWDTHLQQHVLMWYCPDCEVFVYEAEELPA